METSIINIKNGFRKTLMVDKIPLKRRINSQSAQQITFISLIALLLGHLMLNTLITNQTLNFVGLIFTSLFIYQLTLKKKDVFSFVMVIYFCSTFPYLTAKGGGFNLVSFVCIGLYFINTNKFPIERKLKDTWFKFFVMLLIISSILGWAINYTGTKIELVYSIITFFGVIFLLLLSSRLEITRYRIKVFLQLNMILIIYSTIASINKYLGIITLNTPMMPVYGSKESYFEGGGLIGNSPLYGEHSLVLLILFAVFLILSKKFDIISKPMLSIAAIIAYINIFMSISRSVFLLSVAGLLLIIMLQFK